MVGAACEEISPRNIVVAADILMARMKGSMNIRSAQVRHQVTVADTRDGALSGSTPQRSLQLGQGRYHLRADGLQRSDDCAPAHCGYAYHKRGGKAGGEAVRPDFMAEAEQAWGNESG